MISLLMLFFPHRGGLAVVVGQNFTVLRFKYRKIETADELSEIEGLIRWSFGGGVWNGSALNGNAGPSIGLKQQIECLQA
jgi:hypothetical protein